MEEDKLRKGTVQDWRIKKLPDLLLSNWWLIVFFLGIGAIVAALILRYSVPVYQASMRVEININANNSGILVPEAFKQETEQAAESQLELLKSRDLWSQVVDSLELFYEVRELGRIKDRVLFGDYGLRFHVDTANFKLYDSEFILTNFHNEGCELTYADELYKVEFGKPVWLGNGSKKTRLMVTQTSGSRLQSDQEIILLVKNPSTTVSEYSSRMSAIPVQTTAGIFDINFEDTNPKRASKVLSTLFSIYLVEELEFHKRSYLQTLNFLDELSNSIAISGRDSRLQVYEFEDSTDYFAKAIKDKTYAEKYAQIIAKQELLVIKRSEIERVKNAIAGFGATSIDSLDSQLDSLSLIVNAEDENLVEFIEKLKLKVGQYKEHASKFSPSFALLAQERNEIRSQLNTLLATITEALHKEQQSLQYELSQLEELPEELKKMPKVENKHVELLADAESLAELEQLLESKKTEVEIARAGVVSNSRLLDKPHLLPKPVSPNIPLVWAGSVIISLFAVTVLLIIPFYVRNKPQKLNDLELITDLKPIGMMLRVGKRRSLVLQKKESFDIFSSYLIDYSPLQMELLRNMRSRVLFSLSTIERPLIAVTSSVSQEGKTFFSIALASMLSMLEKRTLLIDLDLRKPKMNKIFKVASDFGVTDAILGKIDFDEVPIRTELMNVDLASGGTPMPNTSELIASARMAEFLVWCREEYDYVVVDTSPIGLVVDSMPVLNNADMILYMFRLGYSNANMIRMAEKLRDDNRFNKFYLVVNNVNENEIVRSNYGYGGYKYEGYIY